MKRPRLELMMPICVASMSCMLLAKVRTSGLSHSHLEETNLAEWSSTAHLANDAFVIVMAANMVRCTKLSLRECHYLQSKSYEILGAAATSCCMYV